MISIMKATYRFLPTLVLTQVDGKHSVDPAVSYIMYEV